MTEKISDAQLMQLSHLAARQLGLHFPQERWRDLQRAVCDAARECGFQHDLGVYVRELLSPPSTRGWLNVLASHITVGETYFLREKRSLEVFEKNIVPELMRTATDRTIRIWSAGCATGEEPYSLAILLRKLMADREDWTVEILATDLNVKSLQKASAGIYGEWSFRGVPLWLQSTYFEQIDAGRWAISPVIKKMVTFAHLNLIDDTYAPVSNGAKGFDVIFCRNVLMYLTPGGMRKVVGQLHRSLSSDGWLIVSPTETSQELFSAFTPVTIGGVTFYRKSATHSTTTLALPAFEESKFDVPLPERAMPAPAQITKVEPTPEAPDSQANPKSTASPEISYEQALRLYEQGDYEELEQVIAALSSQDSHRASAMIMLARSYANRGNLAAALVWCDKAIAANKMAARAYYLRATILQEQDSIPEVILALRQAVYAEPEFVLGHFSLGNLALRHGKLRESEKHFENALLLLAQYDAEDIVPESEGLSAGALRQMIVSQCTDMASVAPESELLPRTFRPAGKSRVQQAGAR